MRFLIFWLLLLLAGCAALQEQPDVPPIGEAFALMGRVSVKYGAEAASGKLAWQHDAQSDEMLFSTPSRRIIGRRLR